MKVGKSISEAKNPLSYLIWMDFEPLNDFHQPWGARWSLSNRVHNFRRSIKEKTKGKLWK
jgi:hypothetical protein